MLEYAFMQNALLVSVLISLMCPMIGMFLVLRRYSMIGDTLAHASLAGVAVGLLAKEPDYQRLCRNLRVCRAD